MEVILKELLIQEKKEIHDMALEIGPGENGFVNSLYTASEDAFSEMILRYHDMARGINLESHYVPQTIYWLYIDGFPCGYGKLRHYLNDKLLKHGGHIGYVIRPSCRNKGFGKLILRELLRRASEMNIDNVLLTCEEVNIPSRKIIETNKGILTELNEGMCKYWIKTTS